MSKQKNADVLRFGEQVKRCRLAKGLTQQALADKLGMTPKSISFIERGENFPAPENLFRLAKFLDMSLDEVVFGSAKFGGEFALAELNEALVALSDEDRYTVLTVVYALCENFRRKRVPVPASTQKDDGSEYDRP